MTTPRDYFFGLRGIDKLPYGFASRLVQVSGLLREVMYAAMHVGVDIKIFVAHGVEHTERLLCGGSIVKINQRLIVDGARENGEIVSYLLYVIHLSLFTFHYSLYLHSLQPSHLLSSPRKRFSTRWCRRSRSGSSFIWSITSLTKANSRRSLASFSLMPRWRI